MTKGWLGVLVFPQDDYARAVEILGSRVEDSTEEKLRRYHELVGKYDVDRLAPEALRETLQELVTEKLELLHWARAIIERNAPEIQILTPAFVLGSFFSGRPTVYESVMFGFCGNHTLCALDVRERREIWRYHTGGPITPVVARGGTAYFGSWDKHVYAVDLWNSEEKWRFRLTHTLASPPVIADEFLFCAAGNQLSCLHSQTGRNVWTLPVFGGVSSGLAVSDGTVGFKTNQSVLYGVDTETGAEKWSFQDHDVRGETFSPVAGKGIVCFPSLHGTLVAYDIKTGIGKWRNYSTGLRFVDPILCGGTIFDQFDTYLIAAMDVDTGLTKWEHRTDTWVRRLIFAEGIVYALGGSGLVFALDAGSGTELWTQRIAQGGIHDLVVCEGAIYCFDSKGSVYSLSTP